MAEDEQNVWALDINGKRILKTNARSINLENIDQGYYFLRFKNEDYSYKTIKFQK